MKNRLFSTDAVNPKDLMNQTNTRPAKKQYTSQEVKVDQRMPLHKPPAVVNKDRERARSNSPESQNVRRHTSQDIKDSIDGLDAGIMVQRRSGPNRNVHSIKSSTPKVTTGGVVESRNPRKAPEEIVSHFKNELGINVFKGSLSRPSSRTRGMMTGENRMQQTQNNYGVTRERIFPTREGHPVFY